MRIGPSNNSWQKEARNQNGLQPNQVNTTNSILEQQGTKSETIKLQTRSKIQAHSPQKNPTASSKSACTDTNNYNLVAKWWAECSNDSTAGRKRISTISLQPVANRTKDWTKIHMFNRFENIQTTCSSLSVTDYARFNWTNLPAR